MQYETEANYRSSINIHILCAKQKLISAINKEYVLLSIYINIYGIYRAIKEKKKDCKLHECAKRFQIETENLFYYLQFESHRFLNKRQNIILNLPLIKTNALLNGSSSLLWRKTRPHV